MKLTETIETTLRTRFRNPWWLRGGLLLVLVGVQWALMDRDPKLFWGLCIGLTAVMLALVEFRYLWYIGLATMPLSMDVRVTDTAAITLPGDLVALCLLAIFFFKLHEHLPALRRIFAHPITRWVLAYLLWMGFTSLTSTMPAVSLKFWLSTLWYLVAFFLWSSVFFQSAADLRRWWWLTALPLLGVVGFTIIKHAGSGFSIFTSYRVMQPFYKEHTVYAASIGIFALGYTLLAFDRQQAFWKRSMALGLGAVMLTAVLVSYTRGAWLGVLSGFIFWFLLAQWQRHKLFILTTAALLVLSGVVLLQSPIYVDDETSSRSKTTIEHIRTILDTETDLSNKERINRWVAALEMMKEKPWLGFGPGTYAMQYAPYQQARYRTIISTNQGDNGTTHCEFLLAGSEMGILGLLLITGIYAVTMITGIRGYLRGGPFRQLYAVAAAALFSYYVHAVVNNFLDQDKVAIPVFLCWATIVALDTFHRPLPDRSHED